VRPVGRSVRQSVRARPSVAWPGVGPGPGPALTVVGERSVRSVVEAGAEGRPPRMVVGSRSGGSAPVRRQDPAVVRPEPEAHPVRVRPVRVRSRTGPTRGWVRPSPVPSGVGPVRGQGRPGLARGWACPGSVLSGTHPRLGPSESSAVRGSPRPGPCGVSAVWGLPEAGPYGVSAVRGLPEARPVRVLRDRACPSPGPVRVQSRLGLARRWARLRPVPAGVRSNPGGQAQPEMSGPTPAVRPNPGVRPGGGPDLDGQARPGVSAAPGVRPAPRSSGSWGPCGGGCGRGRCAGPSVAGPV
jgi:hypothetical protein